MTTEIDRRRALQVAALGGAAAVVGGAGAWRWLIAPAITALDPRTHVPLREPPVLASRDGVLDVDLSAAAGDTMAGRPTRALGY
ncbi:MAG TPA: twin-arginine translocation signal domain-containing protein, partial [Ornithinibacter sp.]|nr:twin-arginine translocation signal domain-containing protein [Ornithinibacter sp.]